MSKRHVQSSFQSSDLSGFVMKELIRRALFSSVNIKILQSKYSLCRWIFLSDPRSRNKRMLNVSKSTIHVLIQVHQPYMNAFSSYITLMISRCMKVPLFIIYIIPQIRLFTQKSLCISYPFTSCPCLLEGSH